MAQIYVENLRKITQNKRLIESVLKVKLKIKEKIVSMEAEPENEFLASQVIEAINLGFSVPEALTIKGEENLFEKINIKDNTKRKDMVSVRGRVIGKEGRALERLEGLTNCIISIHGNVIGIIGNVLDVKDARTALIKLINGSKHSNVYALLGKLKQEEQKI